MGQGQEEDAEEDTVCLPGELRSRLAARRFRSIFDTLPAAIRKAYESAGDSKGNKRARQTQIISAAMAQKPGGWELAAGWSQSPVFTEAVVQSHLKSVADLNKGRPAVNPVA